MFHLSEVDYSSSNNLSTNIFFYAICLNNLTAQLNYVKNDIIYIFFNLNHLF